MAVGSWSQLSLTSCVTWGKSLYLPRSLSSEGKLF